MKATISIPDELYRSVKAKSALLGRSVRDVTVELFRRWVDEGESTVGEGPAVDWVAEWLQHRIPPRPGPTAREIVDAGRDRLEASSRSRSGRGPGSRAKPTASSGKPRSARSRRIGHADG
jgi:hypothetical protein